MTTTINPPTAMVKFQFDGEMAKHETLTAMARTYVLAVASIRESMDSIAKQVAQLNKSFPAETGSYRSDPFSMTFSACSYGGNCRTADEIFASYKRDAWRCIVDRMGLKQIMSVKAREKLDDQLNGKGDPLPDITEETIWHTVASLAEQAGDFAREAVLEVFDFLRPRGSYYGTYKTNKDASFRVGKKIILGYCVSAAPGGYQDRWFRVQYDREKHLIALDGVFHLLAGKGIMKEHKGTLVNAINSVGRDGAGMTEFFKFRCFHNGNLHLVVRREDLLAELNRIGSDEIHVGHAK